MRSCAAGVTIASSRMSRLPPGGTPRTSASVMTSLTDSSTPDDSGAPAPSCASTAARTNWRTSSRLALPFGSISPRRRLLDGAQVEEHFDPAHCLSDPLLVLDQGEAHVAVARRPKTHARRDGPPGPGDQPLGEFE